jgi:poly(3-hydroxybutyrate) depolymerase
MPVIRIENLNVILNMNQRDLKALYGVVFGALLLCLNGCRVAENEVENPVGFALQRGGGTFEFLTPEGATAENITVHYRIPALGDISKMPVLFVLHGAERNAASYASDWAELAAMHQLMVFVPEFTEAEYPGSVGYQQGNLMIGDQIRSDEEWLFSLMEPLFDEVQEKLGAEKVSYDAWGHSGGAQFLHRFVLFGSDLRLNRAIAANAGWYTLPEDASSFPYGLAESPINESDLGISMSQNLLIHLGSEDTNFMETGWTGAYVQGDNRFDRGQYFHARALQISEDNGILLNWNLAVAEGIGHNPVAMAAEGAQILYP